MVGATNLTTNTFMLNGISNDGVLQTGIYDLYKSRLYIANTNINFQESQNALCYTFMSPLAQPADKLTLPVPTPLTPTKLHCYGLDLIAAGFEELFLKS